MNNHLLNISNLPSFSDIKYEQLIPFLRKLLKECYSVVNSVLLKKEFNWENLYKPVSIANDNLNCLWSLINHLNAVKSCEFIRTIHKDCLVLINRYNNWFYHNKDLYNAYTKLKNNSNNQFFLNKIQKKTIDNILLNFKLSGILLNEKEKKQFININNKISLLSVKYDNNILDASLNWHKLIFNKEELKGMPEHLINIAYEQAKIRKKKGYLITLNTNDYINVTTYCDNQKLRKEIYYAYNTRASDQGPNAGKWDNSKIIDKILIMRHKLSKILGFKNYTDQSLINKTIKDPNLILNFLNNLSNYIYPIGKLEFIELCSFVKSKFNIDKLNPWDISYYSEKQKQYIYSINEEKLRSFFPIEKVLNGMFKIVNNIYGINIIECKDIDVWHEDVRFFNVFDDKNNLYGGFYLDMYSRDNKRHGAWMDICRNKMIKNNGIVQNPIAYIVCNFNPPIDNVSLLSHNEITTLFHEFGHCLQHILTKINIPDISGINGIPWDAVELSSQFMENYCWEPEVLLSISNHYVNNKSLSYDKINRLIKSRNHNSALFILKQIELSLFDFHIHYFFKSIKNNYVLKTLKKIRDKLSILPIASWTRLPNFFSHIFSGGYSSSYYSYLLSEVLSSDIWFFFKKNGIFNRKIGKLFFDIIISSGGSENPMILFKKFMGRDPKIESMLKKYNLIKD